MKKPEVLKDERLPSPQVPATAFSQANLSRPFSTLLNL